MPTEQPPAAEESLETAVARMARIGSCRSPSFAPDGRRLAFVSDLSGVPQVWTVATEGGWPEQVTALDDQVLGVAWSPDGAWLAFTLAPGGGMNQQIYRVRPDGTGLQRLTDGGSENNWISAAQPWTHDGRALLVASNRRRPEAMDCYLLDSTKGAFRRVADNPGVGQLTDVSRDGRWAVLYRQENRSDDNLFLVDLTTGVETLLTPHDGPGTFDYGRFARDGQTIYLTSNKDRELSAFALIALDAVGRPGALEVVTGREDAELEHFALTEDGTMAALVWNSAGRNEIALLDLAGGQPLPGPILPVECIGQITFSPDGRCLAFPAAGAAAPLDIWVYDRQDRRLWQVTYSPHAGVDLATLVRPELVHFPAHDGLGLSGWLYRPPGAAAPGPTVLSFHGGPEGQERPVFSSLYQALLSRGIAVFAPNVRGSSGFGKTFVNLDNGPLRFDAVRDIQVCLDYVIGAGVADPRRIGIMGGSYGGFMTMAGLTEYPDRFAAGANSFGIVNFETFFQHTEPWMAAISKVEYGDPDTQADLLRALSPIHKIDRVQAPTLVLHGANDTNVPVVEAEQVVESLKRRQVPVEYVLFADEGHGFRKTANRIRASSAIVRWFAQHL
jgi:dipeptidyl aminopeptidase/acylaminoacyl peptidase